MGPEGTFITGSDFPKVKLAAGEGLCIRLNVAAVIGTSLTGTIVWSER